MRMKRLITFLTLLTVFIGVGWADSYTHTFSSGQITKNGGTVTLSGVQWTASSATYIGFQNSALQIGSSNNPQTTAWTLSTSNISGTITEVKINAWTGGSGTYSISVGGTSYGSGNLSTSSSYITTTGSSSGQIVISLKASSKAMYFKSITVTYSSAQTYSVNVNQPTTGGSISASPTSAAQGTTVTLTATPDDGYQFGSWSVKDASNNNITVTNNQFTMPSSNVTVDATFTLLPTYGITVTGGIADPESAYQGQTVTLTPNIPDGYIVDWDNTTVSPSSVEINHSDYTFTMPNEAVNIEFAFKVDPYASASHATFVAGTDVGTSSGIGNTDQIVKDGVTFYSDNAALATATYRLYDGSTTTFSVEDGYKIVKIEFTGTESNRPLTGLTTETGTYTATELSGTWIGESQSVDFSASGQVRASLISVYYISTGTPVVNTNYYLAGDFSGDGWPATEAYKFTPTGDGIYVLEKELPDMANTDYIRFKIVKAETGKDNVYYGANRSGDDYGINWTNRNETFDLSDAGNAAAFSLLDCYNAIFTLNTNDMTFTVEKPQFFLRESDDGSNWTNYEMTAVENNGGWTITKTVDAPKLFHFYNAWHEHRGSSETYDDSYHIYPLDQNRGLMSSGKNFYMLGAGQYTMTVNYDTDNLNIVAPKYQAKIASNITGGSVSFSSTSQQNTLNMYYNETVNVYVTPGNNYELTSLTYTIEGSSTAVDITMTNDVYSFVMPAGNVTINATFTYNGPAVTSATYKKITSLDDLEVNKKYLIVNEAGPYAYAGISKYGEEITITNGTTEIGTNSGVNQMTLSDGSTSGTYIFSFPYNETTYYLTHDGTGGNSVFSTNSASEATNWGINFDSNGNATITDGTNHLRAYTTGGDFRVYAGTSNQTIQLYKEIGVSAPQFSIPAGVFQNSDYPNGISVALTCATDGATIYYSTDGTNFSDYSRAINVTETTTIYAYATKDGKQSNTVSATYTFVDFLVADVVFSPANGDYYHSQTCQMFSTTKGARIYYTTDGSKPVMNQGTTQLYTGEIEMTPGNTYNFKAVAYIGTTPSQVSTANYNILTGDYPGSYHYLYSVAELNAKDATTTNWTMVNPVQVIWMSTYRNEGVYPEFCLMRDNTGYGLVYFGKNNSNNVNCTQFKMGDWIKGGYYAPISNFTYIPDGETTPITADTHPELGTGGGRINNWPTSAMSNSIVLPEYLTIPEIKASDPTGSGVDYWGHYVHLRKTTVQLVADTDPDALPSGQDKDGKWSGSITDENNNSIMYYDKFYLQYGGEYNNWTTTNNLFTGHPNRTFDVYGFVAYYKGDYQISPFDFAWIDKPDCDHETATYYEPQTVTISSEDDPSATIWYKTSDMDDFRVYNGPFTVNSTTTVEWYATKPSLYNDELESLGGSITMTFDEIAKPVISPESQVKAVGESVDASITYEEGNVSPIAVILYTTDGSDPKTSETAQEYTIGTTTLHFTTTTTVRAITRVGNLYSAEADAKTYTFVKSNGIKYTLIDDVTKLKENGVYVIVSQDYSEAMSTTQNVNNRGAAGVLFVEGTNKAKVYGNDDVAQFTLSVLTHDEDPSPERHFLMQTNNSNVNGYLYVGHDVNNSLMTEAEEDAMGNDVAVITIDSDGRAHIHFNYAGGDNRYLQYWNRDRLFNTYKTEYDDRAVYIYGVEATPLATIEKEGVTTEGMNQYTIADELVVVWANADEGKLWCKDQGNVSIAKTEIKDGQVDYMKEVGQQHGEWDQSNWVVLQFPKPTMPENDPIKTLLNNAVGKYIEPATVTGYYIDDNNYTIQMAQAETYTLALKAGADTTKNVYCTANFLPDNLNINGQNGAAGIYHGENRNYFFMNPKIQEVCSITFAEWTGDNTFVVPVNDAQINGSFKVDWTYNAEGPQSPASNTAYRFVAAVQRPQGSTYLKADQEYPIIVYPLDFTAESALPTAINTVEVGNGEIKSIKYVNVAGMVSDTPFQGVNIVVTEYTDGSRTTTKMLKK